MTQIPYTRSIGCFWSDTLIQANQQLSKSSNQQFTSSTTTLNPIEKKSHHNTHECKIGYNALQNPQISQETETEKKKNQAHNAQIR